MSKRNIQIERLEIRMQGVSAEAARAAVGDLGHELLGQLSELRGGRTVRIGRVDSGAVRVGTGASAGELRTRIAKQVAGSIKGKLK